MLEMVLKKSLDTTMQCALFHSFRLGAVDCIEDQSLLWPTDGFVDDHGDDEEDHEEEEAEEGQATLPCFRVSGACKK